MEPPSIFLHWPWRSVCEMIVNNITDSDAILKARRGHPVPKEMSSVTNTTDHGEAQPLRIILTVRIRFYTPISIGINRVLVRDHHTHVCNNPRAASRIYGHCCCGKCSLVSLFENTCPQAYGSLTPYLQSTTLMSFYSSDFLLPIDNWWKVLLNSALLPLGDPEMGLAQLPQHTSTAGACDRKQCFRLRRARTSTSFPGEINDNTSINTFQAGKGTVKIYLDFAKQLQNHQARLLDVNFSTKLYTDTDDAKSDPKSLANIVLLLLIIAGDVEVNPGPESGNLSKVCMVHGWLKLKLMYILYDVIV